MVHGLAPPLDTDMVLSRVCRTPSCVEDQVQHRLRSLCQTVLDQPSQPSPPFNETRAYRVLFTLSTFVVILAFACILYLILCLVPPPAPPPNGKPLSPTSLEQENTHRGARQGTTQGSPSPLGDRSADDQSVDGVTVPIISPPIEGTSSIKTGSGRRTQTSGVHAGSGGATSPGFQDNLLLSAAAAHHPPAPASSGYPGRSPYPKSTPKVESGTCQGAASNPAQTEPPSLSPTIGAGKTITKSLYPQTFGAASLAVVPHLATWFILVIAVGADGLQDPEADLRFIIQAFKSPKVHLVSLLNDKATHTSIRHELRQLYLQAQRNSGSRILVYLTGSGDPSGNMSLFGCATISAQDLQRWLMELYAESTHLRPTLGVVFDICRNTVARPNPDTNLDLPIIWSCSAGQWAYALKLGQNLPSSCFLVSLFLAAHDSRMESIDFEHAFESRLVQQGALIRFIYDKKHESPCIRCATIAPCCLPSPQESEYRQAGRDTFLRLGELIRIEFPHIAYDIHAEITKKMTRWKFLNAEPWYRSFQLWRRLQHLVQGLAMKYPRGSAAAVVQASSDLP